MHYLVDAYNLLFFLADDDVDPIRRTREELIQRLITKLETRRFTVTLVFDSGKTHTAHFPTHTKQGCIAVKFSPEGISADDYIVELLSHMHCKSTTVVTSDRHLSLQSQSQGAKVLTVEKFLTLLNKQPLQNRGLHKPELSNPEYDEYLRKIFEDRH